MSTADSVVASLLLLALVMFLSWVAISLMNRAHRAEDTAERYALACREAERWFASSAPAANTVAFILAHGEGYGAPSAHATRERLDRHPQLDEMHKGMRS